MRDLTTRHQTFELPKGDYARRWLAVEIRVNVQQAQPRPCLSITSTEYAKAHNGRRMDLGGGQHDEPLKEVLCSGCACCASTAAHRDCCPRVRAARLLELWKRWHLNSMRAGCEHQRQNWNTLETLEVVHYGLTHEAMDTRDDARRKAAEGGLSGEPLKLTREERALAELESWYADIFIPPDADDALSGCYEVKKRETKTAGWVTQEEHSKGLLSKPCEVCGYKYGTKWLYEDVPAEVLEELDAMTGPPEAKTLSAAWAEAQAEAAAVA